MNENVLVQYVDIEGKEIKRNIIAQIRITIFAGIKFLFDRLLSLFGLIVALPLMLIIAIAIKLDSKGPVLFKQLRTGKCGKNFYVYKFRTMVSNNDVHDFSKSDEHTRVGKILRKTSLDELPQLYNILKGEMSFIGPRPWITDYYDNMNEKQRHRNDVLPGITGLAQAKGRNNISINEKINYDLEYVKNYSFRQDVKIVFLTIKTVLSKEGADAGKNTIQNELEDLKTQNLSLDDIREAQEDNSDKVIYSH